MIDWNLPLETDEPNPRPVTVYRKDGSQKCLVVGDLPAYWYTNDGKPMGPGRPSVRNVALRTSDECLQRMEVLVRRMAVINECRDPFSKADGLYGEAAAIVKLLPAPPVDPDAAEARRLCNESTYDLDDTPCRTNARIYDLVFAALKRGRELAAQR